MLTLQRHSLTLPGDQLPERYNGSEVWKGIQRVKDSVVLQPSATKPRPKEGVHSTNRCFRVWCWCSPKPIGWFKYWPSSMFFSRKLLPRELRYSTIQKEYLAIKLATQAFRVYLLGKPFTVQTEHRALEWLDKVRENNAKLSRWSLALQPFQSAVQHKPGKENQNADSLSRSSTKWVLSWRRGKGCDGLGTLWLMLVCIMYCHCARTDWTIVCMAVASS